MENDIIPTETVIVEQPIEVKVTDIEMPFISMVTFLTKLVIAAIPALIIAALMVGLIAAVLIDLYRSRF
jgi:hypothetical protein